MTPPVATFLSALGPDLHSSVAETRAGARSATDDYIDTRRWCSLAIASLVIAGLLSLSVVLGRLPGVSRIIDDPLFFKRCLVVHVDLALVVWFYSFLAGLLALARRGGATRLRTAAHGLATVGVVTMLAGALMRGAQPVLANYVPVIDHPLFGAGLAAFFCGTLIFLIDALRGSPAAKSAVSLDAAVGLQAAAVIVALAGATWISARAGLPAGVDAYTRAEFLAWGAGHVLQAANSCAMLAVWLWLVGRISGRPVLSVRLARLIFGAVVLAQAAMPLLTGRGTLDTLYHSGATFLMRWTIFPAVLVVLAICAMRLKKRAIRPGPASPGERVARTGFLASAGLAVLGMVLGACIRGSTTLVPAHYHGSLGAVTVAFMTAGYFVCDTLRRARGEGSLPGATWRAARRQLAVFGVGQSIFALGFAIGGAYGLGRKAYAAEQHVRGAGEMTGLIVMGVGGLAAAAGGLWFLFLVLREIRGWWRARPATTARPDGSLSFTP